MGQLGKQRHYNLLSLVPSCSRTSLGCTAVGKGALAQAEQHLFLAPERAASQTAHAHLCGGSEMQYSLFGRVIQHFVWVHLWEHTDPLKAIGTLLIFAGVMAAH